MSYYPYSYHTLSVKMQALLDRGEILNRSEVKERLNELTVAELVSLCRHKSCSSYSGGQQMRKASLINELEPWMNMPQYL